jgi:hypothetical protein
MMYAIRIGKTAYDPQNENNANRYAVHSQLWNIDRNAGADNVVCKIDEMIDINGIVCDRRSSLTTLLRTIQHIFCTELTDDGCWVVAKIICLN